MDSKKTIIKKQLIGKKSDNKLDNLKCDFFLKKTLDNISKKRVLLLLKYNKKIQKRASFNIGDYKEYCENYSSIEIEIILLENKYCKFININKEDELYYHIYFYNEKEKIKRTSIKENENVRKIYIRINYQIKSFKNLFFNCDLIEAINFKKFARTNIKDMSCMFYGCSSLKELNLSNFNTINVSDMSYMFFGCKSLKELNLSKFNTYKVKNMSFIFFEC